MRLPNGFPQEFKKPSKGKFSIMCLDATFAKNSNNPGFKPVIISLLISCGTTLEEFLNIVKNDFFIKAPDEYGPGAFDGVNFKLHIRDTEECIIIDYDKCKNFPLDLLGFCEAKPNFVKTTREKPADVEMPKHLGLFNTGMMCYANSVLQVLYRIPEFRRMILGLQIPDDGSKNETLAHYLYELFMRMEMYYMKRSNNFGESTASAKDLLIKYGGEAAIKTQNDAHEFFTRFIEKIEKDYKDEFHQEFTDAFMSNSLENKTTCSVCGGCVIENEKFYDISLPLNYDSVPESAICTLFGNKVSDYNCPRCKSKGDADRETTVKKIPDTFFLHLMRFDKNGIKDPKNIDIPKETPFDGIGVEEEEGERKFKLFAIVAHSGDAAGGHYVSYVHNIDAPDTWLYFNDGTVTDVPQDKIFKDDNFKCIEGEHTPYIVIYRRDKPSDDASMAIANDKLDKAAVEKFMTKHCKEYMDNYYPLIITYEDRTKCGYFNIAKTGTDIINFAKKEFDISKKNITLKIKTKTIEQIDPKHTIKDFRKPKALCASLIIEASDPPQSQSQSQLTVAKQDKKPPSSIYTRCRFTYVKSITEREEREINILNTGTYKDLYDFVAKELKMNVRNISICKLNRQDPANTFSSFTTDMWGNRFLYSKDDELYVGWARDSNGNPNEDMEQLLNELASVVYLPVTVRGEGKDRQFNVEADYLRENIRTILKKVIDKSGIPEEEIIIKRGMNPHNLIEVNKDDYDKKPIDGGLYQLVKIEVSRTKLDPNVLQEFGGKYHYAQTRFMEINDNSSPLSVKFTPIGDFPIPENSKPCELEETMRLFLILSGINPGDKKILFCFGERNQKYFPSRIFADNDTIPKGVWSYPNSDLVILLVDKSMLDTPDKVLVIERHCKKNQSNLGPGKLRAISPDELASDNAYAYGNLFDSYPDGEYEIAVDQLKMIDSATSSNRSSLKYEKFNTVSEGKTLLS